MLKVLIIDDDEIVLLIERKILERCGVAVNPISFNTGQKALDYLRGSMNEQGFLILLDINMPGMNGWEFLSNLEEIEFQGENFVVMVTSSIDQKDKETAKKYKQVIGFIEKPITVENCNKLKSHPRINSFYGLN